MRFRYIYLVVIIILIAAFIYGLSISERCTEIDGCKACWKMMPVTVTSELCPNPNQSCVAEPYLQQHNALVDMILCACEKAESKEYQGTYPNTELNHKIEGVIAVMTNYIVTANEICSQPGMLLTKRMYG
jgi:hypothetical protein